MVKKKPVGAQLTETNEKGPSEQLVKGPPPTASYRREKTRKAKDGSPSSRLDSKEGESSELDSKEDEEEEQIIEHEAGHMDGIDIEKGNCKDQSVKEKKPKSDRGKHLHMELGPIPGGPVDETLLKSFREHIAYAICQGNEDGRRGPLRPHYHHGNLKSWILENEVQEVKDKLVKSGLIQLSEGCFDVVDKVLISVLVERWHRETNTFHLPFGEMSITLDDVSQILGIPVVGTPIHIDAASFNVENAADLLVNCLGVTKEDALKELKGKLNVKMSWIKEKCAGLVRDSDTGEDRKRKVDYAVRGYLMFAFGCVVFPDSSGTKVSVKFLKHLSDVDKIHTYSWGTAVLADLYKNLGFGSKAINRGVGGCLTLLQVWIHEHLRFGNHIINPNYNDSVPRMLKWMARRSSGNKTFSLISLREQLDDIVESQVVWDPYKEYRDCHPSPPNVWFKGWLVCNEIEEPIYPDRVKRQLGMQQDIPDLPIRVFDDKRPKVEYLLHWENHIIPIESRGQKAMDDWDSSINYFDWYTSITHRIVQNPIEKVSDQRSEGERSRTLLEEIQFSIDIAKKPPKRSDLLRSLGRSYMLAKHMMGTYQRKASDDDDQVVGEVEAEAEGEHAEGEHQGEGEDDSMEEAAPTKKTKRGKDPVLATWKKKTTSTSSIQQTRNKPTQLSQASKKPTQNTRKSTRRK